MDYANSLMIWNVGRYTFSLKIKCFEDVVFLVFMKLLQILLDAIKIFFLFFFILCCIHKYFFYILYLIHKPFNQLHKSNFHIFFTYCLMPLRACKHIFIQHVLQITCFLLTLYYFFMNRFRAVYNAGSWSIRYAYQF